MEFIGRDKEIKFLEEQNRLEHSLVLIKGKCRVGKSRLIEEFLKDKESLYFEVNREISQEILKSLSNEISKKLGLTGISFKSWSDALTAYVEKIPGKKIIAIDEFPYAIKSDCNLLKEIQSLWDTYLSKKDVMLILCGSSLKSMIEYTEEYASPLYGRNTGNLTVMPIEWQYLRTDDYRRSVEEYAVTGGIPHYIQLMDKNKTLIENLKSLTMSLGAPLLYEGDYLLGSEFSNPASYNTYMKAIANGNRTAEKITSAVQVKTNEMFPYLKKLIELGMVERISSITEPSPEHSRNGHYIIRDNFLKLWYRFVYRYKGQIIKGQYEEAEADVDEHFIDNHTAFVFEDICEEELKGYLRSKGITARYGKYWSGSNEIDVAAMDLKNNTIYSCECKYLKNPVNLGKIMKHIEKTKSIKDFDKFDVRIAYFSASGYDDEAIQYCRENNIILFDCGRCLTDI